MSPNPAMWVCLLMTFQQTIHTKQWYLFLLSPHWNKQCCSYLVPSTIISFMFHQDCDICSCNHLTKANNDGLSYVHLLSLVPKAQKTSSLRLANWIAFLGCGLCSFNNLINTTTFNFGTFLLLCLVSELQKLYSWGLKHRLLLRVLTFLKYFPGFKA